MKKSQQYCYDYPRPAVATDCVVFSKHDDLMVLLIERGNPPFKGKWAFPGGFMEINEDADTCAKRELEEETGIKEITLNQLHTFTKVDRDPRGRMISIVYYGITKAANHSIQGGDDAARARWFSIHHLPELAFDHDEVIQMAIQKIEEKHPELLHKKQNKGMA